MVAMFAPCKIKENQVEVEAQQTWLPFEDVRHMQPYAFAHQALHVVPWRNHLDLMVISRKRIVASFYGSGES